MSPKRVFTLPSYGPTTEKQAQQSCSNRERRVRTTKQRSATNCSWNWNTLHHTLAY